MTLEDHLANLLDGLTSATSKEERQMYLRCAQRVLAHIQRKAAASAPPVVAAPLERPRVVTLAPWRDDDLSPHQRLLRAQFVRRQLREARAS